MSTRFPKDGHELVDALAFRGDHHGERNRKFRRKLMKRARKRLLKNIDKK